MSLQTLARGSDNYYWLMCQQKLSPPRYLKQVEVDASFQKIRYVICHRNCHWCKDNTKKIRVSITPKTISFRLLIFNNFSKCEGVPSEGHTLATIRVGTHRRRRAPLRGSAHPCQVGVQRWSCTASGKCRQDHRCTPT